jgi:hypothetical protein
VRDFSDAYSVAVFKAGRLCIATRLTPAGVEEGVMCDSPNYPTSLEAAEAFVAGQRHGQPIDLHGQTVTDAQWTIGLDVKESR